MEGRRIGRRGLLTGVALGVGASLLEYESLSGRFDHRRARGASSPARYASSLEALDRASAAGSPGASIVHVGHSTHLLSIGGMRALTDPWFYDPAFGALAHERAPAALPSELGRLDLVLITHDHADHADLRAMDEMDKRARVFVATNDLAMRIRKLGYREVTVLAPWEEAREGTVTVAAVPALHDIYEIGFVLRAGETSMYFAGDTRLHPDMRAIQERYAPDVAILPVDGTRLIGGALHVMNPGDAITAARTLRARLVLPSHAEAVFSDVLVEQVLASTVARSRALFGTWMRDLLPGVRCVVPEPGELVAV